MEIKSLPEGDGNFTRSPENFGMYMPPYRRVSPLERVVSQSLHSRIEILHKKYPEVRLAALVENLKTIDEIFKLGLLPPLQPGL